MNLPYPDSLCSLRGYTCRAHYWCSGLKSLCRDVYVRTGRDQQPLSLQSRGANTRVLGRACCRANLLAGGLLDVLLL